MKRSLFSLLFVIAVLGVLSESALAARHYGRMAFWHHDSPSHHCHD